jgi:hypothetical protein
VNLEHHVVVVPDVAGDVQLAFLRLLGMLYKLDFLSVDFHVFIVQHDRLVHVVHYRSVRQLEVVYQRVVLWLRVWSGKIILFYYFVKFRFLKYL